MNHDELRAHVLASLEKTAEPTPLLQFVDAYVHDDFEKEAFLGALAAKVAPGMMAKAAPALAASKAVGRSGLGAGIDAFKNTSFLAPKTPSVPGPGRLAGAANNIKANATAAGQVYKDSRAAGRGVINASRDAVKATASGPGLAPMAPPKPTTPPAPTTAFRDAAPPPSTPAPPISSKPPAATVPATAPASPAAHQATIPAGPVQPATMTNATVIEGHNMGTAAGRQGLLNQSRQETDAVIKQMNAPLPTPAAPASPSLGDRFGLNDGTFGKKMVGLAGVGALGVGAVGAAKSALGFLGSENHEAPRYGDGRPMPAYGVNAYGTPDRSTGFSPYG